MHTATTAAPTTATTPPAGRPWWRLTWADLSLIPLVAGVVLFVRAYAAGAPLWGDEQMIARNIRDRGFLDLGGALDYNQSAPLGWLWAQHAVTTILGTDEYALRLLPLLAALGTLVLAWLIGRRWLGPVGAVVLVSFVATSAAAIRYAAEVKQYSGDLFWTMLLLGATMLLLERARPTVRQYVLWWSLAALACLFSMGAMLATPVFAAVLVGAAWLRSGWRSALRAALPFLVWLAVFVVHYLVSLRYVVGSEYMATFWGGRGYPPPGASLGETVTWSLGRLRLLAGDPLGLVPPDQGSRYLAAVTRVFWLLAGLGCLAAARRSRPFGALLAGVVLFAYVLAFAEVVPLYMRMAIWILPAVWVAVGFAADAGAELAVAAARGARRTWRGALALAGGAAAVVLVFALLGPLAVARTGPLPAGDFDERATVRWLAAEHRPGDVTLVLSLSRHAVGWYADHELQPRREPVAAPPPPGTACAGRDLRAIVDGFQRVLVYGALKDGQPATTGAQVRADLAGMGTVVADRSQGSKWLAMVVELRPAGEWAPVTGCYR
ncbi:glycosyltransferase family 39 protein [Asanoa siamensis]|nr:glycosyltransferase family 39 protein [Asanoa siamensis]